MAHPYKKCGSNSAQSHRFVDGPGLEPPPEAVALRNCTGKALYNLPYYYIASPKFRMERRRANQNDSIPVAFTPTPSLTLAG